ncbi:MAG TPA: hypothetical protein IAB94_01145 [Candidatus Coproplasma avicola]|uniref:Uncharacterized protein n=1 Tax=Candidatus Coproplasma avicola TaxID=2840744 RepID=A0A9D1J8F3_9FIRM|nr:hypothetical protein [Candidatus Coproplasma avicola]
MIDEIIAYKSKTRINLIFVLTVLSVGMVIAWVVMLVIFCFDKQLEEELGVPPLWASILFFSLGAFILGGELFYIIGYLRLPNILIYRSGDQINFCGKFYKIRDIDRIDFQEVYYATIPLHAMKIILKDGTVLKNGYIADTYIVNQKLQRLLFIYKEMRNND